LLRKAVGLSAVALFFKKTKSASSSKELNTLSCFLKQELQQCLYPSRKSFALDKENHNNIDSFLLSFVLIDEGIF